MSDLGNIADQSDLTYPSAPQGPVWALNKIVLIGDEETQWLTPSGNPQTQEAVLPPLRIEGNASLTTLSLPLVVTISGDVAVIDNPALTTVSVPLWQPTNGKVIDFSGNALNATSVNAILARCVATAAYLSGTVNLGGGTNAAATGQGVTDKATLIARGVAVTTN